MRNTTGPSHRFQRYGIRRSGSHCAGSRDTRRDRARVVMSKRGSVFDPKSQSVALTARMFLRGKTRKALQEDSAKKGKPMRELVAELIEKEYGK